MDALASSFTIPYGPRDAGIPLTPDEFEAAEFAEGFRYELIHGVLVVNAAPLEEERDANQELGYWLLAYQRSHPQGKSLDLTLPEHDLRTGRYVRRADRVIWTGLGRLPRTRGLVRRRDIPSIVVEFPSARPADMRRDYDEKRVEYRDLGVREYWIFDRFRRALTVYRWQGKRWAKLAVPESEIYATPLLTGFQLAVAALLAVSDRYTQQGEDE
jgi:Uma2 family endonuclease